MSMEKEKEKEQEQNLMKKNAITNAQHHNHNNNNNNTLMRMASIAINLNVRLKSSDMPLYMQEHALHCTRSLITHHPSNKPTHTHLARQLKKEFDSTYGPAWHCVIGTSFGSYVSHTGGAFFYFSIDSLSVLLFKTEVYLATPPPPLTN